MLQLARSRALSWLGILVCFTVWSATTFPRSETRHAVSRVLPLNRFPDSRAAETDSEGFYLMPTALGDDYFDGTDSPARVERHLRTAQRAGVKYLRCAFSWNGIEPERGV